MKTTASEEPEGQEAEAAVVQADERQGAARSAAARSCSLSWPAFWVTVILNTVGVIIVAVTTPDVLVEYYNGGVDPCKSGPKEKCEAATTKANAALALAGGLAACLAVFTSPLVGSLADIIGRKPLMVLTEFLGIVVMISLLGMSALHWPAYTYYISINLLALFPGTVAWTLFVTDLTPPQERSAVFARIGAATSFDGVLAPLITLALSTSARWGVLLLANCASFLVALFLVRESKGVLVEQPGVGSAREPFSFWALQARSFSGVAAMCKNRALRKVLMLSLISSLAYEGLDAVSLFYLKERFGMDATETPRVVFLATFSALIYQIFAMNPLRRALGLKGLVFFAYVTGAALNLGFLLAPSRLGVYIITPLFYGPHTLALPGMTAVLSNAITRADSDAGVGLGTLQSLACLGKLLGPLFYRGTFAAFQPFAGSEWILGVLLYLWCLATMFTMPASQFADELDDAGARAPLSRAEQASAAQPSPSAAPSSSTMTPSS